MATSRQKCKPLTAAQHFSFLFVYLLFYKHKSINCKRANDLVKALDL